jgi:indolepyruvate ferredoxin oxidoreductase beta subunit
MQYIIVGLGGQGILFTSRVLGHIAVSRGEHVMGSEVHGMAQRGGSVISHFKVGDYSSPLVLTGAADLMLSFDQNEGIRNLHFLRSGGKAILNVHAPEAMENPHLKSFLAERQIETFCLPGYDILREKMGGRFLFMNVLILGALCGASAGDLSIEEVRDAVEKLAPAKFKADNLKAVDLGYAHFAGK